MIKLSRLEALKEKLSRREPVLATTVGNISWTGIIQKMASFPFDFVVLDEEHGTLSTESGEALLRTCRLLDLPSVVRIGDAVPHLISKTLDMGADGIMLPRTESAEAVETAVRCARYFPRGRKGCGGFSNLRAEDKGSVEKYNENRLIMPQIESYEGLRALPEILRRFGDEIACIIIGPYDSSIMLGTPLDIRSEKMLAFIREVFSVCHDSGKAAGIFVDDKTMLPHYKALGADVFWTGTEISLLCEAFSSLCTAFEEEVK